MVYGLSLLCNEVRAALDGGVSWSEEVSLTIGSLLCVQLAWENWSLLPCVVVTLD